MNILRACADANLFGKWFRDPGTWSVWFAFLAALFGIPMTDEQMALYHHHTGRAAPRRPPARPPRRGLSSAGAAGRAS